MDGARRVLRSVADLGTVLAPLAFARPSKAFLFSRRRSRRFARLEAFLAHPFVTILFVFGTLGGAFAYTVDRSGAYEQFIQEVGTPGDLVARMLGMGVDAVTISGLAELREKDVLTYAGVKARNSLPFLDANAIRDRLRMAPLVKDAEVRKLYPNRLSIAIVERQPFALWQRDGQIQIVSADGMPLGEMRDDRFVKLPLVVGADANVRIAEYGRILAASGDLASRVKAGALISQRRWTLYMNDGLEVRLPEDNPEAAMTKLAQLQREQRLFDRDIVAIDARVPGRLELRLTDETAARKFDPAQRAVRGKV